MEGTNRLAKFTLMLTALLERPSLTMITIHSIDKTEHITWSQVQSETGGSIDTARLGELANAWGGPVYGPSPLAFGTVASQYMEAGVDVLDVAPTAAWLLGIPVAENLPGRILTEAFDDAFVEAHPINWTFAW